MKPPLQPVRPGQPFAPAASDWNAMLDAARAHQAGAAAPPLPPGAAPLGPDQIWVANGTAQPLPRFGVYLAFSCANRDAFAAAGSEAEWFLLPRRVFFGIGPYAESLGFRQHRIAILDEPIPAWTAQTGYGIGRATIAGYRPARVNFTDATHQYATLEQNNPVLQSAPWGPLRVVTRDTAGGTTGEAWAVVFLQQPQPTFQRRAIFTTAGTHTWTAPTYPCQIEILAVGGGGGGSASVPAQQPNIEGLPIGDHGGGGGSAGAGIRALLVPRPGQLFTLVVGAGGAISQPGESTTVTGDRRQPQPNGPFVGAAHLLFTAAGGSAGNGRLGGNRTVSSFYNDNSTDLSLTNAIMMLDHAGGSGEHGGTGGFNVGGNGGAGGTPPFQITSHTSPPYQQGHAWAGAGGAGGGSGGQAALPGNAGAIVITW